MFHWGIFRDYSQGPPQRRLKLSLFFSFPLSPANPVQEPEEKRIVQELLETEQAYVARLHLLDQVSGQDSPT